MIYNCNLQVYLCLRLPLCLPWTPQQNNADLSRLLSQAIVLRTASVGLWSRVVRRQPQPRERFPQNLSRVVPRHLNLMVAGRRTAAAKERPIGDRLPRRASETTGPQLIHETYLPSHDALSK